MSTTFYIPIKSVNLAHYLSSGIIAPANFIRNRNQDLQNRFENNLLLSLSKFTEESNCSIEIVLNEKKEVPKKISNNFFLFNMPLPISRIKTIYFSDEQQKTSTLFNITNGAAFVPSRVIKISDEEPIQTAEIGKVPNQPTKVDWSHYLKKYDQIIGGFALMKIGKEGFQNYSSHFFKTLGNINNLFDKILQEQNINLENIFEFAFTDNGKFKMFHDTIYSDVSNETVSKYAAKDNIKIETRNGLVLIDKIPENTQTYIIAILDTYGPGKRKQIDSFISDLVSDKFNAKRKEGLSLTFGINKGYSVFRNKYKTENFESDIKFKFDSKLDYYIIESIYQNIFNGQNYVSSFSFIDDWCPVAEGQKVDTSSFATYTVLDKTIVLKKKEEFFLELFRTSLEKRNKLLETIIRNISKALPKFLSLDTNQLKQDVENEYELVAKEYSKFIFEETSKKLNAENKPIKNSLETMISELEKTLQNKENEIKNLKEELNTLQYLSNTDSTKENKTQNETGSNAKEENEVSVSEPKESYEQPSSGTLFSDETPELKQKKREKELRSFKVAELRMIANNLDLSNISSLRKNELVNAILEKEF
jgi:hypothetical protein